MQIVTANRLADGLVVFLTANDAWSEALADARIATDGSAAASLMTSAESALNARLVVGPYLIDVQETPTGIAPVQLRERIRAAGPTVRSDLGRQAEKDVSHVSL